MHHPAIRNERSASPPMGETTRLTQLTFSLSPVFELLLHDRVGNVVLSLQPLCQESQTCYGIFIHEQHRDTVRHASASIKVAQDSKRRRREGSRTSGNTHAGLVSRSESPAILAQRSDLRKHPKVGARSFEPSRGTGAGIWDGCQLQYRSHPTAPNEYPVYRG